MNFKKSISKDEINKLEMYQYSGEVELIDTEKKAILAASELMKCGVLGFDTETKAAFKKGESYDASLLQLGTDSKVYLFRLNKIPLVSQLVDIFENPHIIKTGVAIRDDLKDLKKLHPFKEQGFIDLAKLAQSKGIKNFGLRALTAIFLSKRLSKREQTSNWEKNILTEKQVSYAACDAAVAFQIYKKMSNEDSQYIL